MNPWDRQPTDTDEQFLWFVAYRDAIPPRALGRIRAPGGTVRPPLQVLLEWANAGHWTDRVAAWDQHLDTLRQRERESAAGAAGRQVAEEQEAALTQDLLDLAHRELDKLLMTSISTPAETLRPGEVNRMIENVVKLRRLQRGESTEQIKTDGVDLSGLTVEELRQLVALKNKARGVQ
jgi:hypothetical protein